MTIGRARYLLESSPGFSAGLLCAEYGGIEGMFTPYKTVDDALGTSYCADLYPTRQAYSDRVAAAADRLIVRRYLLPRTETVSSRRRRRRRTNSPIVCQAGDKTRSATAISERQIEDTRKYDLTFTCNTPASRRGFCVSLLEQPRRQG